MSAGGRIAAIRSIEVAQYQAHSLHRGDRAWIESNCYIDVWLEILHVLGLEPLACLPFALALDFEGDQWTFFKPPHSELTLLYGLEVEELNLYRPLLEQVVEQLRQQKLVLLEVDAIHLPDTAATDYRKNHVKTTIAVQEIDIEARRLGYFHNSGYYALDGEDFAGLFALDKARDQTALPLFAEFVRLKRLRRLPADELLARSLRLLRTHLERRPDDNPLRRFSAHFEAELVRLREHGLAAYHAYAFATLRQLGSAFELSAAYLRWLDQQGVAGACAGIEHCETISSTSKALILKGARAVNGKRALDADAMFSGMESAWDALMQALVPRFGSVHGPA
jgi:hypothetical protein